MAACETVREEGTAAEPSTNTIPYHPQKGLAVLAAVLAVLAAVLAVLAATTA